MKKISLSLRSKLLLIIVPFLAIVAASVISSNQLLSDLGVLSEKSVENFKFDTLQTFKKDLDASVNLISYNAKDAVIKSMQGESQAADAFLNSIEIFKGQLSDLTGQMKSLNLNEDAKNIETKSTTVIQSLIEWGDKLNKNLNDAKTANAEIKAIRKSLRNFVKDDIIIKNNSDASADGIYAFVIAAQKKFKTLNISFTIISITILILCIFLLNYITKTLDAIIQNLAKQFLSLQGLSVELQNLSGILFASTQSQASSVQETVATMEEMTAMVRSNTSMAESSQANVQENTNLTKDGVQSVDKVIHSIQEVKSFTEQLPIQIDQSEKEMQKIIQVIEEINNKTKVINDIVFQTKLLSFNASVEAARAGEQGKGFAVVAEEVGNLATMSGSASQEITTLLSSSIEIVNTSIQKNNKIFSDSSNNIMEKVKDSVDKASACTNILNHIENKAQQIGNLMKEIVTASKEQSTGIEGINQAIRQLDQVSHENSTVANQTAKAGNDLQDNTIQMQNIIDSLEVFLKGKSSQTLKTTPE